MVGATTILVPVTVPTPGLMLRLVAPLTDQERVLDWPEEMLVGLAVKFEIVGMGAAAIVQLAVPAVEEVPAALVAIQPSWTDPEAPAVKVIWFVLPPAVIVPPVMVQAYVQPVWVGTEAVRPVALAVTLAGAVMTGIAGGCTTVMRAIWVTAVPTELVTVRV